MTYQTNVLNNNQDLKDAKVIDKASRVHLIAKGAWEIDNIRTQMILLARKFIIFKVYRLMTIQTKIKN